MKLSSNVFTLAAAIALAACSATTPVDRYRDADPSWMIKEAATGRNFGDANQISGYGYRVIHTGTWGTRNGEIGIVTGPDTSADGEVVLFEMDRGAANTTFRRLMGSDFDQKDPFNFINGRIEGGDFFFYVEDGANIEKVATRTLKYRQDASGKFSIPSDMTTLNQEAGAAVEVERVTHIYRVSGYGNYSLTNRRKANHPITTVASRNESSSAARIRSARNRADLASRDRSQQAELARNNHLASALSVPVDYGNDGTATVDFAAPLEDRSLVGRAVGDDAFTDYNAAKANLSGLEAKLAGLVQEQADLKRMLNLPWVASAPTLRIKQLADLEKGAKDAEKAFNDALSKALPGSWSVENEEDLVKGNLVTAKAEHEAAQAAALKDPADTTIAAALTTAAAKVQTWTEVAKLMEARNQARMRPADLRRLYDLDVEIPAARDAVDTARVGVAEYEAAHR